MLILKKIAAGISVIIIVTFIIGNLVFIFTRILDAIIDYPHYEWYRYKISFIHCLAFGLISCFYSYLCYVTIIYFFSSLNWVYNKVIVSIISVFIVYIGIGVASGGGLNLQDPIAASNVFIFLIMAIILPFIEAKTFHLFNLI